MDCSQGSSKGPEFDDVGISDSFEELSLLNGEEGQYCLLNKWPNILAFYIC